MKAEEKVYSSLKQLLNRDIDMSAETRLRDDLNLDSVNLIELTVLMHTTFGIDLGRKSAEHKLMPATVGDLVTLVEL